MEKLRAAVIGCGKVGRFHADAFRDLENSELVACLDSSKERADAFAKEYTGRDDHSEFDKLSGRFACLDVIVRTYFVEPTLPEKLFFWMHVRKLVKKFYL